MAPLKISDRERRLRALGMLFFVLGLVLFFVPTDLLNFIRFILHGSAVHEYHSYLDAARFPACVRTAGAWLILLAGLLAILSYLPRGKEKNRQS